MGRGGTGLFRLGVGNGFWGQLLEDLLSTSVGCEVRREEKKGGSHLCCSRPHISVSWTSPKRHLSKVWGRAFLCTPRSCSVNVTPSLGCIKSRGSQCYLWIQELINVLRRPPPSQTGSSMVGRPRNDGKVTCVGREHWPS